MITNCRKKDIVSGEEFFYNKSIHTADGIFLTGNTLQVSLYAQKHVQFKEIPYRYPSMHKNMCNLRKGEGGMGNEETFLMKPKVDFCFKELMEDAEIRRGFISALLGVEPREIERTELLPTFLRKEHSEDKLGILDIRIFICEQLAEEGEDSTGKRQMDLEIQIAPFPAWPERSLFYLAKMYTGLIQKGQDYDVLQKCIHVGILDFTLFDEDEEFYSRFHLWEDSRRRMYTDKLEIHILELTKLKRREYPETELLNWARFFNAEKKEEFEMAAGTSQYIERAYERLNVLSADEEKRLEYEAREKAIRDHNYLMTTNLELGRKKGFEQGKKAGLEEGRREGLEEGLEKGLKEGLEKGLEEGLEKGLEQGVKVFIELCQDTFSREETAVRLIRKLSLSSESAEEYLEKYWVQET